LDYLVGPWQIRVSHAQVRFNHETPTDEWLVAMGIPLSSFHTKAPEMGMADHWGRFSSIGLVYDEGPLNIQLMLNRIENDSPSYEDSKAGYVLAAYRLKGVTPYIGYSQSVSRADPLAPISDPLAAVIAPVLVAASHIDQHTYTLGGRWDVQKNLALKAQVDWIRGKPSSVFLFKNPNPGWDGNMTVFSLALDFVF
jgi:hypothetical protein